VRGGGHLRSPALGSAADTGPRAQSLQAYERKARATGNAQNIINKHIEFNSTTLFQNRRRFFAIAQEISSSLRPE